MLTKEQLADWERDGYLVIPDFLPTEQCEGLRSTMERTVREKLDLINHPRTCFTTYQAQDMSQDKHMMSKYFLQSGDNISFFFEEACIDEEGAFTQPAHTALNKVGHALHTDVPEFQEVCECAELLEICRDIGLQDPVLPQSMYIYKSGGVGGAVTPHKDSTFLHTGGTPLVGFWIPIDDAREDNGCLWFIPGSHKEPATLFMNRNGEGTGCDFVGQKNANFDDEEAYVCVPAKAGSLVLIHGNVVHKSHPNTSEDPRNAFTFHCFEGKGAAWAETNWNLPTDKGTFVHLYEQ